MGFVNLILLPGSERGPAWESGGPIQINLPIVPRVGETITLADRWDYYVHLVNHDVLQGVWLQVSTKEPRR